MDDAKQQLIDKLKTANNVLVTVSRDPSVDQLASCIGLTLMLNKQGKHAAAVFSGEVPSTLEFLQPEETIEKNTDSLRDFIIALDKSKADKLRYKVEDNVVRIFITPYKTSISQDDLEFSEGDFNVDLVIALGVRRQEDLDEAITSHGRILHDATVTSVNTAPDGGLGSINWFDPQASSLSELVTELCQSFGDNVLDQQIATALLTGIVSETERFSNDKTSSQTMSISAALMGAGANQQLVASKLEEEQVVPLSDQPSGDDAAADKKGDDGTLRIEHVDGDEPDESPELAILSEDKPDEPPSGEAVSGVSAGSKLMTEPPTMGGTLTANSHDENLEPTSDPMSLPDADPPQLLDRKSEIPSALPVLPPAAVSPPADPSAPLPDWAAKPTSDDKSEPAIVTTPDGGRSLTDLEKSVGSPHAAAEDLDTARDEVDRALAGAAENETNPDQPIQGLNAQPLGGALHDDQPPPQSTPPANDAQVTDPNAPPPVPPPIPFQFGNSPPPQ